MVLVHGFLGAPTDWSGVIAAMGTAALGQVVTAELPGHGDAPALGPSEGFADAVRRLADSFPAESVDLVGYSMGGRLSMALAAERPQSVRRLVVIAGHPGLAESDRAARSSLDAERATALREDPSRFLGEWAALPMFGGRTSAAWREVERRRQREAPEHRYGWAASLAALSVGSQGDLWSARLPPTLFVAGSQDAKYCEVGRRFVQAGPGRELAIVENAHHAVHLDAPEALAALLGDWLSRQRD